MQITGSRSGRKKSAKKVSASGRLIRTAEISDGDKSFDLSALATVKAALIRSGKNFQPENVEIRPEDFRKKVYARPLKTLIVFVLDCSDSMGDDTTFARIRAAKGTILSVLSRAYQKRHRIGLVSFRDEFAEVLLPPTSSLALARAKLRALPTGGATPFADGLIKGWRMIRTERLKDPELRPLLMILSDGEANVPFDSAIAYKNIPAELHHIAHQIGQDSIHSIAIDTRPLRNPGKMMKTLAQSLGAAYHHISTLQGDGMARMIVDF